MCPFFFKHSCCCWGPAVVDISFIPDSPTVVGVLFIVGVSALAGVPVISSIHTAVAVARVLLLFTILLFLVFPPLLESLIC